MGNLLKKQRPMHLTFIGASQHKRLKVTLPKRPIPLKDCDIGFDAAGGTATDSGLGNGQPGVTGS